MRTPALSIAFVALIGVVSGQTPSASVVGRVTDPSGAVVPGAAIRITNLDTGLLHKAASNAAGDFTVPYLNPGRYSLEAAMPGFREHKRGEFNLEVNQVLRLDIPLEVGTATETVTVNEAPPALNTENSSRGEVTTHDEIKEMPLDGRNFADLAYLTGGVIPRGDGNDGTYAVNGARADNTGFLLDGMNNTQRRNTGAIANPPIEGIQEFKLLTSGFSAEYGRYAGGMLTVVTKSGTNRLRGSVYEFLRNDALDAQGYFDPFKAKLRRNQFGATISGPVLLPRLHDGRNRTFFMFTWESLRLANGQSQRGVVPLPEMLAGDFSKAVDAYGKPVKITDAISKQPFPNNQIPASRLNPVAKKLGAYFPQPNLTSNAVYNYVAQGNATNDYDNLGIKLDHSISSNDRLTGSAFWRPNFTWDPVNINKSPVPYFGSTNQTLELLSYLRYVRIMTPTLFLEASANFSRRTNHEVWPYSADKNWAQETGFAGGTTNPLAAGPPFVSVTGYIALGPNNVIPKIWTFNNYQYAGTFTWIKSAHTIKFGGDFLRSQYFSRNYGDTRGRASFINRFSGHPLGDFVLGWADSTRRQLDGAGPYHLMSNSSAFIQDDYKVSSSLTLNLGLRYDLLLPPQEKYGAWSMFILSLGKLVTSGTGVLSQADFNQRINSAGLAPYTITAAAAGLPPTITNPNWKNLAPRFGFAWRILGSTHTVLRGGYGIFYGTSSIYRTDTFSDTYPFNVTETYSRVTTDPTALTLSDPFPAARRGFSGVNSSSGAPDPFPASQYIQSWSLSLERQLRQDTTVEIAFAGSKGTHLPRRYDVNQPGRDPASSNVRPYPFFSAIDIVNDGSNSIYNSGQATLRRRFGKRMFLRATYTFAKSIDDTSNTGGTIAYNFAIAQDSRNLRLERGRSDFDIGHGFSSSFIWAPQFGSHWLARNWQLSGTGILYSGAPYTPRIANYSYLNGEASRPDRLRKGTVAEPTPDRWFDRLAFLPVPTGAYRFGNSGRNILDGPGTISLNVSFSRRFALSERAWLQFRLEGMNLPNHPNFLLPENNIDVATAGTIKTARNSRNLQAGIRIEF